MNVYDKSWIIIIFLVFVSVMSGGCLNQDNVALVDGNIGDIQVTGDVDLIMIRDYHLETIVFNSSEQSTEAYAGILFNDDVISYKVTGNATSIADEILDEVVISVRFYGGISKGVFILHSSNIRRYFIDPDESWSFDVRFSRNDEQFSKINFFDIKIEAVG